MAQRTMMSNFKQGLYDGQLDRALAQVAKSEPTQHAELINGAARYLKLAPNNTSVRRELEKAYNRGGWKAIVKAEQ